MRRIAPALLLALVAVTTGCGGDDTASPGTTTRPAASTLPASTLPASSAPTTSCPEVPDASTESRTGPSSGPVLLRSVAVVPGDCADRFEMRFVAGGPAPAFRVGYEEGPFVLDPSDLPAPVAGSAFVVVRLEPAYPYDYETGEPTYTGPDRLPGGGHIREAVELSAFEAVLTWVIGVDARRPFRVESVGGDDPSLVLTF